MELENLKKDRFLRKDSNQEDSTKGATYASVNPAPKKGNDSLRKIGRTNGSEEDHGAENILTGTVITACFIQTSGLPSRIELEGNDITFFDDTFSRNGKVVGDTSRIIFTHGLGRPGESIQEGFILEKRASVIDTYDNVLSLYSLPAREGKTNYTYFGLDGRGFNANTNYTAFYVNHKTGGISQASANGAFIVVGTFDGVVNTDVNFGVVHNSLIPSLSGSGFSVIISATGTGIIGIASDIIPFGAGIDIGSASAKMGTFFGSVSACPLPTVENALDILAQIPDPSFVAERGHYGLDRKYFDDLTFPPELLYTDAKGRVDIEHNHMLGFLLKVVVELKAEIDLLKSKE